MKEQVAVPKAEFRSYYGRPVLKPPVWEWKIPAYLFTGGLSAGSALLGAGADLTGRPVLRRASRAGALGALAASMYLLVADLGRPERFLHMLRVAKPSSPMSVGTWILVAYGPGAGVAGVAELVPRGWRGTLPGRLLGRLARPAGLSAAAFAPGVASYTAVLLSQTAVPAWQSAHRQLPFVFTGSAAASGAGWGMVWAPVAEAGPARRLAVLGAAAELVASKVVDQRLGLVSQAYTTGKAHRLRKWSEYLTLGGAAGALAGRRSRAVQVVSGLALLAGSALQRFGVFEAGVESTKDPRYVVVPQRDAINRASGR
ncbi:NrfD/PsrC family molybdoenzyme membrane anchor subunit [Amycolatopsis thermoflava]|uniref:Formate-dependent nitrite reductase membrane component NrfD n=1 Tax=Amycolatopsis thermoflava TaxID=84480 RepID=A0A3N2H7M8_9PSEU|nr:NrfD/PsrC family molybdoenzyme membrane anchor subunit [Amycolatopsis thermoflava]ROS44897.1 formate-dependent nitrite reductase membrane component NrfD [Amycolatopsis thermoflava]